MSTDSKIRPLILKGGIAVYESVKSTSKTPMIIVFQYNPEDLKRTLANRSAKPKSGDVGGAKEDVMKSMGPPVETITLKIVINVVDQLSVAERTISEFGIYPQLSVLEMLLYPTLAKAKRIEKEVMSTSFGVSAATFRKACESVTTSLGLFFRLLMAALSSLSLTT